MRRGLDHSRWNPPPAEATQSSLGAQTWPPHARLLRLGGGSDTGFFGGLSGHQGALRSAFLAKAGLDRDAFVGTGVVSAVIVDSARLLVYGLELRGADLGGAGRLVLAATLAAFVGSFLGSRLLRKVTLRWIQALVGVMLVGTGIALAAGVI